MPLSISDRLKALGVQVGARDIKPSPASRPGNLTEVLGGSLIQTPQGEAFVIEARYPTGFTHGQSALEISASLDQVAEWVGEPRLRAIPPESIVFIDTETTGLSGGTGTYAFLIGAGRFEGEEFVLQQWFMRDPLDEPAQLAALEAFLAPAQAIATFNGKAFDAPLLNTRFITQGLRSPLLDLTHIDLLHLARRLWKDRLPSRTLGNLEVQILGALRSEQDIPGWMIPQIYFDFLRDLDPTPLKKVLYHNAMDVISLAALLNHIAWLLTDPLELGGRYGIDLIALARLFEDLGDLDRATMLYIHSLEHEDARRDLIPRPVLLQALCRLALIHKRHEDWSDAIQLWEQAAHYHHLEAYVDLAKCYEHHLNNLPEAIRWTEAAMALVEGSGQPESDVRLAAFQRHQWQADLEHRLARLNKKLDHSR
jgi:uncharacterized protein YprB with RNaseH-like and TPR domain